MFKKVLLAVAKWILVNIVSIIGLIFTIYFGLKSM